MRLPILTLTAIATLFVAADASAQTYDPRYPVCMHVYTPGRLRRWRRRLFRLLLHLAAAVPRHGFGPLRELRPQSLLCLRRTAAAAAPAPQERQH